jgi:hypothetical protein
LRTEGRDASYSFTRPAKSEKSEASNSLLMSSRDLLAAFRKHALFSWERD